MKKLIAIISVIILSGCSVSPYTNDKFTEYDLNKRDCDNNCYFTNDIQRQVNLTSYMIINKRP